MNIKTTLMLANYLSKNLKGSKKDREAFSGELIDTSGELLIGPVTDDEFADEMFKVINQFVRIKILPTTVIIKNAKERKLRKTLIYKLSDIYALKTDSYDKIFDMHINNKNEVDAITIHDQIRLNNYITNEIGFSIKTVDYELIIRS